jgi:transposase
MMNSEGQELETRRREAARLLQSGMRESEVARQVKASRMTVWRWKLALDTHGPNALDSMRRAGRRHRA